MLTGRAFVGGLDPDAGIDHTAGGLIDQTLAGRPLDDWTDADLRDYCDHYNIGWVVCWSDKTAQRFERFRRWQDATDAATVDLRDGGPGRLVRCSASRRSPCTAPPTGSRPTPTASF